MINPSAPGWIDKFFLTLQKNDFIIPENELVFYKNIRKTGFVYGHIIAINNLNSIDIKGMFTAEISKIALLNSLYQVYILTKKETNSSLFIEQLIAFYDHINPSFGNVFQKLVPKNLNTSFLEKIIDERVQTNESILNKNFTFLVTNAFLFIDVLAFQKFLIEGSLSDKYLKRAEETVLNIVTLALKIKANKSKHDDALIKLFEASIRYNKFSKATIKATNFGIEALEIDFFSENLEHYYFLDIAAMTLWRDGILENEERYFLHLLSKSLVISDSFLKECQDEIHHFISQNKNEISYLKDSNPVKNFYEQTTQNVSKLIIRNKKRLLKEISQSKELMVLLVLSTKRELDLEEKKKIKKQILDICKTIPSLTIFLIPGGGLLLPILIKFIPQLLPSAFNENLEEK
jgi:LETM1-like protein